jgi:hypothetical protein
MKLRTLIAFALLAVSSWIAPSAFAWDHQGHMVSAQISWGQMTPKTRKQVAMLSALMRTHDGTPYNAVTLACWMDDIRSDPALSRFKKWHFVDAPYQPTGEPFVEPAAEGGDALTALAAASKEIVEKNVPAAERAQDLAEIMHIVGDLHQPLHCENRGDLGGNKEAITGIVYLPGDLQSGLPYHLHILWDMLYRYTAVGGKPKGLFDNIPDAARPDGPDETGTILAEAHQLESTYPLSKMGNRDIDSTDPVVWCRESFRYACLNAYPSGYSAVPDATGQFPSITITGDYLRTGHDIAAARIVLAGHRMAMVLNALLDPKQ